ncbi:hypothetical protein HY629_02545, partial [Candidatus Uhrbacteria bacterium]|nr:hypothetical protein [Candidatus Uhrbacteria bacterium]
MRNLLIKAVIIAAFLPLPLAASYDAEFMKGYNFPVWWHDSYLQKWSDASFTEMVKEGGATWVAVGPFWYQKDMAAPTI